MCALPDVIVETPRLIIRKLSLSDVQSLKEILGDVDVMKYSLKGPLNAEEIKDYVTKILSHYQRYGYGLFGVVEKESAKLIGLAGLISQTVEDHPYIELGYRLAKNKWRQGYAIEAATAILDYSFNTLNIDRIISIIEPENIASIKLAKKIGMERIKSTTWHRFNVDIYEIQKIQVLPFDPSWEMLYEKEKNLLQQIFTNLSITFYHIGSTSILDCSAKPIIDIIGVVNDVLKVDSFNDLLEDFGFIALGEYGMKQRRFFRKRLHSFVNLHIFEDSDPEVGRHLRFRNYLRAHPEKTKQYSELKYDLSTKNSTDIERYILGKEKFIKEIDFLAVSKGLGPYCQKFSSPRKSEWSRIEILNAMEANMHLHMTYFAKYLPIMHLHYEPGVTIVVSDISDTLFNYVLGAHFDEKNANEKVAFVLKLFQSKKRPFSWWISERDTPDTLPSLLIKNGLSFKEDTIGMFLDLHKKPFKRRIEKLSIQRVLSQRSLKDFTDVMASMGGNPQLYEQFFIIIPPALYGEGASFEMYVGYIEEKPIVTGILVLHANVGGIYYVMTHPEYRKQGYATEMMLSLVIRIQDVGYHLATLQASAHGRGLYQQLGFEPICRFVEYA